MGRNVITVVRSVWSRGVTENSLLVSKERAKENRRKIKEDMEEYPDEKPTKLACKAGGMCCLGFACLALGSTKAKIRNVSMPNRIDEDRRWAERVGLGSTFCMDAAQINDDASITDEERERRLVALCDKFNKPFVFQFVD